MQRLDLTLPTPAENLALDEALLDWAETENPEWEFLRLWESPQPLVVVGRSSRVELEVNLGACRQRGIEVMRRSSGGATIVTGPGCMMYAVVLSYRLRPELKDIRCAHTEILGRFSPSLQRAVHGLGDVSQAGTSDLVFVPSGQFATKSDGDERTTLRKFSGNSLRAKRTHLLYHGTLLYNFDLQLIEDCLLSPPRQPDYRNRRSHEDFVINLPLARSALVEAVDRAWPTNSELAEWPQRQVVDLAADRFSCDRWNLEFP
jgi:lipoate---protein ligase